MWDRISDSALEVLLLRNHHSDLLNNGMLIAVGEMPYIIKSISYALQQTGGWNHGNKISLRDAHHQKLSE